MARRRRRRTRGTGRRTERKGGGTKVFIFQRLSRDRKRTRQERERERERRGEGRAGTNRSLKRWCERLKTPQPTTPVSKKKKTFKSYTNNTDRNAQPICRWRILRPVFFFCVWVPFPFLKTPPRKTQIKPNEETNGLKKIQVDVGRRERLFRGSRFKCELSWWVILFFLPGEREKKKTKIIPHSTSLVPPYSSLPLSTLITAPFRPTIKLPPHPPRRKKRRRIPLQKNNLTTGGRGGLIGNCYC